MKFITIIFVHASLRKNWCLTKENKPYPNYMDQYGKETLIYQNYLIQDNEEVSDVIARIIWKADIAIYSDTQIFWSENMCQPDAYSLYQKSEEMKKLEAKQKYDTEVSKRVQTIMEET